MGWRYEVDVQSAIRTLEDLEPGQIDIKLARRNLASALRRAKADLPEDLAGRFEGLAQWIERKRTIKGIDEVLQHLYDLADEERIWLDKRQGPRDWLPPAPPSMGALEERVRPSSLELIWNEYPEDPSEDSEDLLEGAVVFLDRRRKKLLLVDTVEKPYDGHIIGFVNEHPSIDDALDDLRDWYEDSEEPFPDFDNALRAWREWELNGFPSIKTLSKGDLEGVRVAMRAFFGPRKTDVEALDDPIVFIDDWKVDPQRLYEEYGDRDVRVVKSSKDAMQDLMFEVGLGPVFGPREWKPKKKPALSGLEDIPLPPNIPRPEMWDAQAVVKAVKDGFTFLLPFIWGESLFSPNAYWIRGVQASASGLTVGPEHTPEMELLPDGWMKVKTYFFPEMVPEESWLEPPNKNGVVPVYIEIDPETIDWDLLNRGHQIRVRRH